MHTSPFTPHHLSSSNLSFHDSQSRQHYSSSPANPHSKSQSFAPAATVAPSSTFDSTAFGDLSQYMSEGLYLQNPAIRLQQSTPLGQVSSDIAANSNGTWSGLEDGHGQLAANPLAMNGYTRGHQRAASASSIASSASSSYSYNQPAYSIGNPGYSPPLSAHKFDSSYASSDRVFSNNLPTPTHTPTTDSFTRGYPQYSSQSTMPPQMALKQELLDGNTIDDELPGFSHSAHSVSSFANSPSTPHTIHEDIDDRYKVPSNDLMRQSLSHIDRSIADDLFASSHHLSSPQVRMQRGQPGFLSPYNKNQHLAELLHEANKNRSHSPTTAARPLSPFRQSSPYAFDQSPFNASPSRMASAAQLRQQQKEVEAIAATRQALPKAEDAQAPKTISPKDVQLEYNEVDDSSRMPLFPDEGEYSQPQFLRGNQYVGAQPTQFDSANFDGMTARSQGWIPHQNVSAPPQSSFTFTPTSGAGIPSLSFPTQHYRTDLSSAEPTPDFPAHLTSMESSASEADLQPSRATPSMGEVKRPDSTLADAGTYSCTYHGCMYRFDSPQKLQKHKRDAHRQNPPHQRSASPAIGSNMSSAALLARNSQAGPHKCERINPTTGKPCNAIFSRPYDLTRHEDTIHNARKQKVRCALCVEEKTFSRNDALTRHMRVVHPEVDFPGKHRRRGGHD